MTLDDAIAREVSIGGRLESRTSTTALVVHGRPVNHVLHLLLTLVTCGTWGLVWGFLALVGGEKRVQLSAWPDGTFIGKGRA